MTLCSCSSHMSFKSEPVMMNIENTGESLVGSGPAVFKLDGHFVWGASVLKSEEDGKYYMVFSAPESGKYKFSDAWVLGSKMGLAVSDYPDRDFKFLGFFMNEDGFKIDNSAWDSQTVSNPNLHRFGDKYYLYYIGSRDPVDQPIIGTLNRRNRIQQNQQIGVLEFDSFDGLFRHDYVRKESPLLSPRTRVKADDIVNPSPEGVLPLPDNIIVVNPSVVYDPRIKKYLLYFKGNIYDPSWRGVHGMAVSDSPTGPFKALDDFVFEFETSDGKKSSAEDPFVWYNRKDKLFYAIFKDFNGKFTKSDPGLAIMYSKDGIKWDLPQNSLFMSKKLVLDSGDTLDVNRLERPQLLLDESDNPIVLYCACSIGDLNNKKDGSSFNVQIDIKRTRHNSKK